VKKLLFLICFLFQNSIRLGVTQPSPAVVPWILWAWTDDSKAFHSVERILKDNHIVYISGEEGMYEIMISRSTAKFAARLVRNNIQNYPELKHLTIDRKNINE
jgi:hypothetical protein